MPDPITDEEFLTGILRIADRLEPTARRAFLESVSAAIEATSIQTLEDALRSGITLPILEAIQVQAFERGFDPEIQSVLMSVIEGARRSSARMFAQSTGVEIDSDLILQRAARWARGHSAELVRQVTDETRAAIRSIISESLDRSLPIRETRKRILGVVGLTEKQARAVVRFRDELAERGLSVRRVNQLTERYRRRLLRHRATLIARNETMTAGNQSQRLLWEEARRQGVIQEGQFVREWVAIVRDGRVCPICWGLHGQRAPIGGTYPDGRRGPLAHVACLPGDTSVLAPDAWRATKRWYEGDLVVLTTGLGHKLACTPNHPILTPSGWKFAQFFEVGDQVICGDITERESSGVNIQNQGVPSTIEEVTDALGILPGSISLEVPLSAEEFHGDCTDGEIAVVRTNRFLRDRVVSSLSEEFFKLLLIRVAMAAIQFSRFGRTALNLEWNPSPDGGLVSCGNLSPSLFGGHSLPLDPFLFAGGSDFDLGLSENALDGVSGGAVLLRNLVDGNARFIVSDEKAQILRCPLVAGSASNPEWHTGKLQLSGYGGRRASMFFGDLSGAHTRQIITDELVDVGVETFSGHVYNLETVSGSYISNGIVTHNCRCQERLVRPSDRQPVRPPFIEPATGESLRPAA